MLSHDTGLVGNDGGDRTTDRPDAVVCRQSNSELAGGSDADRRREETCQKTVRRETQLCGYGT